MTYHVYVKDKCAEVISAQSVAQARAYADKHVKGWRVLLTPRQAARYEAFKKYLEKCGWKGEK